MDVVSTDKPAEDTERYLAHGNTLFSQKWADGKWCPDDLIGKNGSDAETKAQSASYATPDLWDKVSEPRLASSAGHVMHHERPANVCLGWGGYDKFSGWQASGRQVTKDMVEKEEWSTDLMATVNFVNESGEVTDTVVPSIEPQDLPNRQQEPVSLYEVVNAGNVRDLKTSTERTAASAGTLNNRK